MPNSAQNSMPNNSQSDTSALLSVLVLARHNLRSDDYDPATATNLSGPGGAGEGTGCFPHNWAADVAADVHLSAVGAQKRLGESYISFLLVN